MKLLSHYNDISIANNPRILGPISVDKSLSWGFFYGACQGKHSICGLRFVLHFSPQHYFSFQSQRWLRH